MIWDDRTPEKRWCQQLGGVYIYIYIYSYTYIYIYIHFSYLAPKLWNSLLDNVNIYIYIYIYGLFMPLLWEDSGERTGKHWVERGEWDQGPQGGIWTQVTMSAVALYVNTLIHKAMDADWINFIFNEVPDRISKNLVLCSLHFTTHSFTNKAHSKPDFHKDSN